MNTSLTVDLAGATQRALDVLILDDSDIDRQRMRRYLSQSGVQATVVDCATFEGFSTALSTGYYDAVLIDYRLGSHNGIEAVNMLRNHRAQREAAAIMITGDRRIELAVEAIQLGCDDFLLKEALDPQALRATLVKAMIHRRKGGAPKSAPTDTALALRDAIEEFSGEVTAEVRRAVNAAVARTRNLRATNSRDPAILAELAHIDAACSRVWTAVSGFERNMSALDVARPRVTRLGLTNRRIN